VRLRITKRIPVAGGMAGGSADAAAALRLVARAAEVDDTAMLEEIGQGLGSDVPSQVRGGCVLAEGAGERLRPLPARPPYAVLVLPVDAQLGAGAVYAEADRLGLARDADGLSTARRDAVAALEDGMGDIHTALQDAARSLCAAIDPALDAARATGADHVLVSGSGPTVVALFCGEDRAARAERSQAAIAPHRPVVRA
jgi:4-diphosphocytidyl-2-C-methyl-D-erythritol kinase